MLERMGKGGNAMKNLITTGFLVLGLAALPAMAQSPAPQPDQPTPEQQQQQQAASQSEQQGAPAQDQGPAPAAQPPYQEPQQAPPPEQAPPRRAERAPAPAGPVPETLRIPAGTVIHVRTNEWLSSDHSRVGDLFNVSVAQPLVADGWVVMRRGQNATGRVAVAEKAGRVKGTSQLGVELNELTLVDGQVVPVKTALMQTSAGTSNGRDAAAVAGTTGLGAAIGAAVNGGTGAGVGAGIGAVSGLIGVLSTRGRPTVIPPESELVFRLQEPITISTVRAQMAFRPATQSDYGTQNARNQRPYPRRPYGYGPYPPYPPYPPYAYPYPYPYPYPYGPYYGVWIR
jgi:hypothetical protein